MEAIIRETKEETGLVPRLQGIIGAYRIDNDPRGIHIDIIYEGSSDEAPSLSEEHRAFQFFEVNKLPDLIAYKHREAIADWLNR